MVASPALLTIATVGYLVERTTSAARDGRVHSVFDNACNLAVDDTLLTIVAPHGDDAPTVLRLAPGKPVDFPRQFSVGERVGFDAASAHTPLMRLEWGRARVWQPAPPAALRPLAEIEARCALARTRLREARRQHPSVLDREGAPIVAAWTNACARSDAAIAASCVDRLIGWGEGLTPAGDDFLIGALAALDGMAIDDASRGRFRRVLAASIAARLARTTPVSAHLLRLAVAGHYGAMLLRLRDALLSDPQSDTLDASLSRALAVGASSGADTVTGLVCGISASLSANRTFS